MRLETLMTPICTLLTRGPCFPRIEQADTYEPDYRNSFWGAKNYVRLAAIKKRVDPQNVLQVWHGVGFDESSSLWRCYKA